MSASIPGFKRVWSHQQPSSIVETWFCKQWMTTPIECRNFQKQTCFQRSCTVSWHVIMRWPNLLQDLCRTTDHASSVKDSTNKKLLPQLHIVCHLNAFLLTLAKPLSKQKSKRPSAVSAAGGEHASRLQRSQWIGSRSCLTSVVQQSALGSPTQQNLLQSPDPSMECHQA